MSFSQATFVKRVRVLLGDNPWHDICTEPMDTTETGLDVADTTKWSVGDIVEFQDDGEQCLVTALASATTLTVARNYLLSVTTTAGTGTTHATNGDIVKITRSSFTYQAITEAAAAVIRGLYPYVYKSVAATITPDTTKDYYEVDEAASNSTEIVELSSVYQLYGTSPVKVWSYGTQGSSYPAKLYHNIPTSLAGSGVALWLPFLKDTSATIYVTGIGKITPTVAASNYSDLSDGVSIDCVTYYTVARLIAGSDIYRTTQEDVSMGDQSVVPMRRTQVSQYWEQKGTQERHKWEEELRITLPRMPLDRTTKRRR